MTVERREGPTPAGGAYAEAIYKGDRLVEIAEYDEGGIPLARTYATGIVATRGEGRYLLVQTDETSPPDREPSGPVGRIYDRETGSLGRRSSARLRQCAP